MNRLLLMNIVVYGMYIIRTRTTFVLPHQHNIIQYNIFFTLYHSSYRSSLSIVVFILYTKYYTVLFLFYYFLSLKNIYYGLGNSKYVTIYIYYALYTDTVYILEWPMANG